MGPALKYCGLTRLDDLVCALESGVAFVGFNFFEHSKRFIEPKDAADLWHQAKVRVPNVPQLLLRWSLTPAMGELARLFKNSRSLTSYNATAMRTLAI